jgi:cytochrome c-type biogenesis protein CcmH/NrfG
MNGIPDYEMQNHPIVEQAKAIARKKTEADLLHAQTILLDHLKDHPQDTQVWLLLMRIEWNQPLEDFGKIMQWAHNILAYDPTNAYALLFLAEAFYGNIDEDIYAQLCHAKSDAPNIMAMIEIAKANHLECKDNRQDDYEKILTKSIEYGPEQAINYWMLGRLYIKQGKVKEGEELLTKSAENQEKSRLLYRGRQYDDTSLAQFVSEWYTGLYYYDVSKDYYSLQ